METKIGKLNDGTCYCFPNGYSDKEFRGTWEQCVEVMTVAATVYPTLDSVQ